jgi:hypothetical protein
MTTTRKSNFAAGATISWDARRPAVAIGYAIGIQIVFIFLVALG